MQLTEKFAFTKHRQTHRTPVLWLTFWHRLPPQARVTLPSSEFKRSFRGAFQAQNGLSFFLVGTGSTVIAFAVTNLTDSQFAQIAADAGAFSGSVDGLVLDSMAEDAGVELHYHTEVSQLVAPPPGDVESASSAAQP
jgi:aspartate aminotransferase-like enzyme